VGGGAGKSSGGSGKGTSGSSGKNGTGATDGGTSLGNELNPDAFFANDPPPMTCDGGPSGTVKPGGTIDCPDDKNREGCVCMTPGMTAPCWPGLRKNRGRGQCKDGVTTCVGAGEIGGHWGECKGFVLPDPNATSGPASCQCFSAGQWKLDNLSPCFIGGSNGSYLGAVSTIAGKCPDNLSDPPVAPAQPFTTDSLKVDCAGHFKLCYTLRAGKKETASDADCVMARVCTEADYLKVNEVQSFPALPSWATTTDAQKACAQQFAATGGYGEMTVEGISVECDEIGQASGAARVFNRITYCPLACLQGSQDPICKTCTNGGSGGF
jgi:hypothetical protein